MSPRYSGRREFHAGPTLVATSVGVVALFAIAGVTTYRARGWTWVSIGMVLATMIALVGVVERLLARIELGEDAIVVRTLRGERRYPRSDIERLDEARGTAPALRLRTGTWVRLPAVGHSLGNSLRAWLKDA